MTTQHLNREVEAAVAEKATDDRWVQEFTFEEVALALAQYAISRGSSLPYSFDMSNPILTKLAASRDPHNYMRLTYARPAAPANTDNQGGGA